MVVVVEKGRQVRRGKVEIQIKGELPKTIKELRRMVTEEYYSNKISIFKEWDNFSARNHSVMIAYIRHHHTNYDELIEGLDDNYEYRQIKQACNAKAEELLGKIRSERLQDK